jgi:molybdopterin converting factor small subunit
MTVVLIPAALRSDSGEASRLTVGAAGSLRAVLDEVCDRWPRLGRRIRDEQGQLRVHVNVFVDGEDCRHTGGLDTIVRIDTEVQVVPSVAGG